VDDIKGDVVKLDELLRILRIGYHTWWKWQDAGIAPVEEMEPRTRPPRYRKADLIAYVEGREKVRGEKGRGR